MWQIFSVLLSCLVHVCFTSHNHCPIPICLLLHLSHAHDCLGILLQCTAGCSAGHKPSLVWSALSVTDSQPLPPQSLLLPTKTKFLTRLFALRSLSGYYKLSTCCCTAPQGSCLLSYYSGLEFTFSLTKWPLLLQPMQGNFTIKWASPTDICTTNSLVASIVYLDDTERSNTKTLKMSRLSIDLYHLANLGLLLNKITSACV